MATVAAGVLTGGTSLIVQGAAIGFTAGAVGTLVGGGSVGSALRNGIIGGVFGAVGAGLSYAIGSGIGSFEGRALAHGALNSFMTRVRGELRQEKANCFAFSGVEPEVMYLDGTTGGVFYRASGQDLQGPY